MLLFYQERPNNLDPECKNSCFRTVVNHRGRGVILQFWGGGCREILFKIDKFSFLLKVSIKKTCQILPENVQNVNTFPKIGPKRGDAFTNSGDSILPKMWFYPISCMKKG